MNTLSPDRKRKGMVIELLSARETEIFETLLANFRRHHPFLWPAVSPRLIHEVWETFVATGHVVDDGRFEKILDGFRDAILHLRISTLLAGHTAHDPVDYFEEHGLRTSEEAEALFDWMDSGSPTPPISDYALDPLLDLLVELQMEISPATRLKLADRILNLYHQRGDLSALLVAGGRKTVLDLPDIESEPSVERPQMPRLHV